MINKPLVSIIIPSFNRADLISETLDSVLKQTYDFWECIIVDDGSVDASEDIVSSFIKKNQRFYFYQRERDPKGASTCRNIGLGKSKGEYVIFLDSDDLLAPYCLMQRLEKIKNSRLDFAVFPMMYFTKKLLDSNDLFARSTTENDINRFLRYNFPWSITCPIWKKESILELKGFNEKAIGGGQDWDLHVRSLLMGLKYENFIDALPDCFYRRHNGERISNSVSKEKILSRYSLYLSIFEQSKLSTLQKEIFSGMIYQLVCIPLINIDLNKSIEIWEAISINFELKKGLFMQGLKYLNIGNRIMHRNCTFDKILKRLVFVKYPNFLSPVSLKKNTVSPSKFEKLKQVLFI